MIDTVIEETISMSDTQTSQKAGDFFANITKISDYFSFYSTMQESTHKNSISEKQLNELLKSCTSIYPYDVDISLYDVDGILYATTGNSAENLTLQKPQIKYFYFTDNLRSDSVVSYAVAMISTVDYLPIGYLSCSVTDIFLNQCYNSLNSADSIAFMCDKNNRIVSCSNKNIVGMTVDNMLDYLNISPKNHRISAPIPVSETPFTFYSINNKQKLISFERDIFIQNSVYLLIILFLLTLILSLFLSHVISKLLKGVYQRMSSPDILAVFDNNRTNFFESGTIYEIDNLHTAFDDMRQRIHALLTDMTKASEQQISLEKAKRQAEVALLQSQINPHFLYNTFESINVMIKSGNQEQATAMILSLSEMLTAIPIKNASTRLR